MDTSYSSSAKWLINYYCVIFDVISPACGLAVAVSAAVLISMYKDIADTVTVRVSGMIGLCDAIYQISQLIIRELCTKEGMDQPSATARVFAFASYFFPLLVSFMTSRVALDLEVNFLGWWSNNRLLRRVTRHYTKVSVGTAFLFSSPLFFATASFNPALLYVQWTFGSLASDISYMVFGFYLWVLLQLLNFVIVVVIVTLRLQANLPSTHNHEHSLSTDVMRTLEQRMRRKARILILYPLSPMIFFTPSLIFYWFQSLHLEPSRAAQAVWMMGQVIGPLQSMFDMAVFAALPPVQKVMRWYWVLHKDTVTAALYVAMSGHRGSIFVGPPPNLALSNEEAWVQEVAEPRISNSAF
ncbi:hypothetical protein EC988_002419 [Linderina pennispora]|nr:hypothetical protein EC988_002419 [Linderina pennispora]